MLSLPNAPINDSSVFYSIMLAATAGLRMKSLIRASNSLNVSLVGVYVSSQSVELIALIESALMRV